EKDRFSNLFPSTFYLGPPPPFSKGVAAKRRGFGGKKQVEVKGRRFRSSHASRPRTTYKKAAPGAAFFVRWPLIKAPASDPPAACGGCAASARPLLPPPQRRPPSASRRRGTACTRS